MPHKIAQLRAKLLYLLAALAITFAVGLPSAVAAQSTVAVTIKTSPAPVGFTVDGSIYIGSKTFSWVPGSKHAVDTGLNQTSSGNHFSFLQWNLAGGLNHSQVVTVPATAAVYTASFIEMFRVSGSWTPTYGGHITVTPAGNGYYPAGTVLQVSAFPTSSCRFVQYSGIPSQGSTTNVTVSKNLAITGQFACATLTTITTAPANLPVVVDGAAKASPFETRWWPGTSHAVSVNASQTVGSTKASFVAWSDGSTSAARTIVVGVNTATYTAQFSSQMRLTTSNQPSTGGSVTVSPVSSDGYYPANTAVTLLAAPLAGCSFLQYTGAVRSDLSTVTTTMNSSKTITAQFGCGSTARSADDFVDSIGTNVHLNYKGTPYYDNFPMVEQILVQSGLRHIRGGMVDTSWQDYYNHFDQLGVAGVKAIYVTSPGQTASYLIDYPQRVPHSFEGYEGTNEYDLSGKTDWATILRDWQTFLYTTVKGNTTVSQYPVIAPSLTSEAAFHALGDITNYADFGNLHNYYGGRNPGTRGWGPKGYGSIPWSLALPKISVGDKPVMVTETGYMTIPADLCGSPEFSEGRYIPRTFFEHFNAGIARTYAYELIDEHGNSARTGDNFGLNYNDGTPKPAFAALQNIIHVLADPGPSFVPPSLSYSISGSTSNVHQTLLAKRNGTFYLAVWLEVSNYDVNSKTVLGVAPQAITVQVNQPVGSPVLYSVDDNGAMTHAPLQLNGDLLQLSVTDRVSLIELPPGS